LGLAVGYRKIGIVVLKGEELHQWHIARSAYDDLGKLKALVTSLIEAHHPNVVVIERTGEGCRKGEESQRRIAVIGELARERGKHVMEVPRQHEFENKYEEAAALALRYPDLERWVPEPVPCWENEPRRMIMFEALAMTDTVMRLPTEQLAAAKG